MTRADPVGDRFFKPLQQLETTTEVLFYVGAALSLAALIVNRTDNPTLYDCVQIAFILAVLVAAVLGLFARFYVAPRAAAKRRQDLLSNTFGVPLTHDTSAGYYNNDQTNPFRRLAASTMESAFFTAAILRDMLFIERIKILAYLALWIIAALIRSTDLTIIAVAAQIVFGEQTLSKWLRMEWLRMRSETVYSGLHSLFTTHRASAAAVLQAHILDHYTEYETGKSAAHVFLSSRVFRKRNPDLTAEWNRIRASLGI